MTTDTRFTHNRVNKDNAPASNGEPVTTTKFLDRRGFVQSCCRSDIVELGSFPWPVFGRHCVLAASGLIAKKLEAWIGIG